MRKFCALLCGAVVALASCASSGVSRVDSSTATDISGYWNDTDVRIVAENLVADCLASNAITSFSTAKKRAPVLIVGEFTNKSDEHISTATIVKKIEVSLINSGKVEFVADSGERELVRGERADQLVNASESSAKSVGNETAADFMLIGSVKTIVDSLEKTTARTYYVTAELIDIETNRKVWAGEDDSVKKIIKKASVRK